MSRRREAVNRIALLVALLVVCAIWWRGLVEIVDALLW